MSSEETLDPQDWRAFEELAHNALDDVLYSLRTVRERPVWRPVPDDVLAALDEPVPRSGQGCEAAYRDFTRYVQPYPYGNIHPRFWGWVNGSGTPLGVVADLLTSGMNSNVGSFDQSATRVEVQVIGWLRQLIGLPAEAAGLFVSGGSVANLVGLTVARNDRAGWDVRRDGLPAGGPRLTVYASSTVHSSVQKAVELLGMGAGALRLVPARGDHTMDLDGVAERIAADRAAGDRPIALVVSAGTIDAGAIDPIDRAADLAAELGLWLHVDGAIGALGVLSEKVRPRLAGIERADSVALDLHKWLHAPFEAGCVLVASAEKQRAAFHLTPPYLAPLAGTVSGAGFDFKDHGVQLSRRFNALKVWLAIKAEGTEKFGRLIDQNVAQAAHLVARIEREADLELLAPAALNIVCFRYRRSGATEERLDAMNRAILTQLHRSGLAVPNSTLIEGRFAIRVAITNHRSRLEDFDLLADTVLELGRAM